IAGDQSELGHERPPARHRGARKTSSLPWVFPCPGGVDICVPKPPRRLVWSVVVGRVAGTGRLASCSPALGCVMPVASGLGRSIGPCHAGTDAPSEQLAPEILCAHTQKVR